MRLCLLSARRMICECTLIYVVAAAGIASALFASGFYIGLDLKNERSYADNLKWTFGIYFEDDNSKKNTDVLKNKKYTESLINAQYYRRFNDGVRLVGWNGGSLDNRIEDDYEVPVFTARQTEKAENVLIINSETTSEDEKIFKSGYISLDETEYRILAKISTDALDDDIYEARLKTRPRGADGIATLPENYSALLIMPYTTFLKSYEPEYIILNYNHMDKTSCAEMLLSLKRDFPEADINGKAEKTINFNYLALPKYLLFATAFTSAALFVAILLFLQWLHNAAGEFYIYRVCGCPADKIIYIAVFNLFVVFFTGAAAAYAALGISAYAGIINMPVTLLYPVVSGAAFIVSAVAVYIRIKTDKSAFFRR